MKPNELRDDPILVYGAPRSGTTYLQQIFDAHPEVAMTNEFRVFTWLHRAAVVSPADDDCVFESREPFVRFLGEQLPDLVRRHYRALAPGAKWWGDKNPHYAQDPAILRTVAALFPAARFVHIHRDPRAVIASLLRKKHADGTPWIGLEDAHVLVVGHVRNALQFHREVGAERAFVLCYEQLVADDEGKAGELFRWLGIPMAPLVLDLCRHQRDRRTAFSGPTSDLGRAGSRAQAVADWRAALPVGRLRESLQFLAPILLELGYETEASLDAENRSIPA